MNHNKKECKKFFKTIQSSINLLVENGTLKDCHDINNFYLIDNVDFISEEVDGEYWVYEDIHKERKVFKNFIYLYDRGTEYNEEIFGLPDVYEHNGVIVGIDLTIFNYYKRLDQLDVLKEKLFDYLKEALPKFCDKDSYKSKKEYKKMVLSELCVKYDMRRSIFFSMEMVEKIINKFIDFGFEEYRARTMNGTWDFDLIKTNARLINTILSYRNNSNTTSIGSLQHIIKFYANTLGYYENMMIQYAHSLIQYYEENLYQYERKVNEKDINFIFNTYMKRNGIGTLLFHCHHKDRVVPHAESISIYNNDQLIDNTQSFLKDNLVDNNYLNLVNKANLLVDSATDEDLNETLMKRFTQFKWDADRVKFLNDFHTRDLIDRLILETATKLDEVLRSGRTFTDLTY